MPLPLPWGKRQCRWAAQPPSGSGAPQSAAPRGFPQPLSLDPLGHHPRKAGLGEPSWLQSGLRLSCCADIPHAGVPPCSLGVHLVSRGVGVPCFQNAPVASWVPSMTSAPPLSWICPPPPQQGSTAPPAARGASSLPLGPSGGCSGPFSPPGLEAGPRSGEGEALWCGPASEGWREGRSANPLLRRPERASPKEQKRGG